MVNQLQAVSKVMNQPSSTFSSELQKVGSCTEVYKHKETVTSGGGLLVSIISGLNYCNIQISPQFMVVNVLQAPTLTSEDFALNTARFFLQH